MIRYSIWLTKLRNKKLQQSQLVQTNKVQLIVKINYIYQINLSMEIVSPILSLYSKAN